MYNESSSLRQIAGVADGEVSGGEEWAQQRRSIAKTYDYKDADGKLLYQAVRYEPKDFSQRRPNGKGWIWNLNDTPRVLYRLPELLEYPDGRVFFCEGEKDADRVASLGHCATTVASGSWKDVDTQALARCEVLILEDNDDKGRLLAQAAAETLHRTAATIRIVRLPGLSEGGDVSDWLNADPENESRLVDVCFAELEWQPEKPSTAPSWRDNAFTAANLRTMTFNAVEYVVPGLIPEGVSILAGKPKVGKSWLALDIALAVSGGRFVLGDIKPPQGDVLYAALEDNKRRLWKRIRKILATAESSWPPGLTLANQWRRLDAGGVNDIREWAASVPKPRLVILDTLAGVRPDRNTRDTRYDGDYKALRELHAWANEAGIAVLVLHHTRKMEADDPIDTISGSLGLAGCADTSVILARTHKGTTLYVRGRDVEEQEHAMLFNAETCRWTILGDAAEVQRSYARGKLLTALEEAADLMTPADLTTATGLPRNSVDQRLLHMLKDGEIIKVSRGCYAHASRRDLVSKGGLSAIRRLFSPLLRR
jgi:AAA domain